MCRRCDVVCFWMGLWWDVSYVCCWATAAAVCWQSEWVMMWPVVPTMVRLGIVLGPMGVMFGMSTVVYRWDVIVGWCVYVCEYEVQCCGRDVARNVCLMWGLMGS